MARDILGLTKLNYNACRLGESQPITVKYSDRVGEILGAREDWMNECSSWRDDETGEIYYTMPFEEWYEPQEGIVPVSQNGETASYSLVLSLNKFGRSFLLMDDYLADPDAPEKIGFTLE